MGRERREIIYSVIILLFVPLLLGLNTILFTKNVRKDFNTELRRKADMVNTIIAETIKSRVQSGQATQAEVSSLIASMKQERPELRTIRVIVPSKTSKYELLASTISSDKISTSDTLQFDVVSGYKKPVAKLVEVSDGSSSDSAWDVATPVVDSNQDVIAVVNSEVLTGDVDQLVDKTFTRAFLVVILSILATFGLLAYHFKFVAYADLLRKQKEINQTMNDFLSVATHELKAPMTIIKGYTASTLEGDFGVVPEKMQEPLGTVLAQTDRLNNLVMDLLNISRIEQGRLTFDMQPVSVAEVVQLIVKNYNQKAAEKNIQIVYDPPATLPMIFADAGRVQEVMTNLIDNAIKYSVKGTVTIVHSVDGSMVKTAVRDTGIGMSAQERSRLFQRFYRVKNDQTKDISGTGLGLWIIKQYIEKMGGKIEVDSMVGAGTEFNVWFKQAADTPKVKNENN